LTLRWLGLWVFHLIFESFLVIISPLLFLTGLSLEINICPEKYVIDYLWVPATNFLIFEVVRKVLVWSGFLAHVWPENEIAFTRLKIMSKILKFPSCWYSIDQKFCLSMVQMLKSRLEPKFLVACVAFVLRSLILKKM
jgi:hypothetical protein